MEEMRLYSQGPHVSRIVGDPFCLEKMVKFLDTLYRSFSFYMDVDVLELAY